MGRIMNYYFTGTLIILLSLLAFCVKPAHSGSTQTNTSGSNTAIEGGYTSSSTTTYQSSVKTAPLPQNPDIAQPLGSFYSNLN